jgi:hypothetical protein
VAQKDLFEIVSTPRDWPLWHHNSEGVDGDVDGPLNVGSVVEERGKIPGRSGLLMWRCARCEAPTTLVLEGTGMGGHGRVVYTFADAPEGTVFNRELEFSFDSRLMRVFEWLVTPLVRRQQTRSVGSLKVFAEALARS